MKEASPKETRDRKTQPRRPLRWALLPTVASCPRHRPEDAAGMAHAYIQHHYMQQEIAGRLGVHDTTTRDRVRSGDDRRVRNRHVMKGLAPYPWPMNGWTRETASQEARVHSPRMCRITGPAPPAPTNPEAPATPMEASERMRWDHPETRRWLLSIRSAWRRFALLSSCLTERRSAWVVVRGGRQDWRSRSP